MNEAYVTGISAAENAAMTNARPRASAAAFRELTARLRKAEVPSFTPVAPSPQPVIVPAQPEVPAPVFAPEPAVMPVETVAPVAPPPALQAEAYEPLAPPPAPDVIIEAVVAAVAPAPAEVESHAVAVAPAAEDMPQAMAEEPASAEAEDVAGLDIKKDAANEELREQIKSRQVRAELDLIWRMLLATPTSEERSTYLREAAEIMSTDAAVPLPPAPPGHDLSQIAPASDAEAAVQFSPSLEAIEKNFSEQPVAVATEDDAASAETSELARSLLDMMASGASSGLPQERALAADTLLRLLPKLDTKSLVMLAQRVARMDSPPPLIVARLIRDPRVEVSGPLLEDCTHITDKDLEMVIAEKDLPRLRMVARRRGIGPAITDALVNSGDASVQLTLVRNAEAEFSQEGFKALIAAAGSNIDLLAPLCTRADMSAPMAFELFWHAPAQLRRFILSRFLTDSETLTKILRITMSTNEDDKLVEQEVSLQHTVVEALERAARGRIEPAAKELGTALKIDMGTAQRVLRDKQGEPLIVLLKTAGYPRQALMGLLNRFKDEEIGIIDAERDLDELVSIFETLSFNKARILLTYWDWSQRGTGPYAPLD